MSSAVFDLGYLLAAEPLLEDFLLVDQVYWPIHAGSPAGEPPFPQLTLGSVLVSLRQLQARRLPPERRAEFHRLQTRIEVLRTRWRVAWENKARREISARLRLWRDYLEELRAEPQNQADRYRYEVGRRVMLALLLDEVGQAPAHEIELLRGLDGLLAALFEPGDFLWDVELAAGFPPETFWYLYGSLRESPS